MIIQLNSAARCAVLLLLRTYKCVISPWLPGACRFVPTCSEFAGEAVEKHGVILGSQMALARLLRCHPFRAGGVDLVD